MSSLFNLFRCGRKKWKQNEAGRLENNRVPERKNYDQIELSLGSCSISSSFTTCSDEFQQSSSDGLEITENKRLSAGCYDDYDYYQRSSVYANTNPYYGIGYSPYNQQQTQTIVVQGPDRRAPNPSRPLPIPAEVPDLPPAQIYCPARVQPIGFEALQKGSLETVQPPQSRIISTEVVPANVHLLGLEAIGQTSTKGSRQSAKKISGTNMSAEGVSAKAVVKKTKILGSLKSAKEPSNDDIDNNRPLARTYASSPVKISFKDIGSVKSVSERQNSAPSSKNWDKVDATKSSRKVRAKGNGVDIHSYEVARNAQARSNEVRPKKRARRCC